MKSSDFVAFDPLFSAKEKWGDLERINWLIPWMCYQIRKEMKVFGYEWPMIIHCAYETDGHSPNSYHYKGLAVDFHFNARYATFVSQYVSLEAVLRELKISNFIGFGAYPQWNNPGFHIDLRGHSARWINIDGNYVYGNEMKIKKLLFEHSK